MCWVKAAKVAYTQCCQTWELVGRVLTQQNVCLRHQTNYSKEHTVSRSASMLCRFKQDTQHTTYSHAWVLSPLSTSPPSLPLHPLNVTPTAATTHITTYTGTATSRCHIRIHSQSLPPRYTEQHLSCFVEVQEYRTLVSVTMGYSHHT